MSQLSNKIDELIMESGETVQSLAEIGKINRTTLQRVKSGERLPTPSFFKKMCRALRLSPTEEQELETLLEMATVGERVYGNRQKIVELIETISELTEYKIPFSKELRKKEGTSQDQNCQQAIQVFNGEGSVLRMIENSIDKELFLSVNPQLKLAIPFKSEKVYDYIFQQMMGNTRHLILLDVLNLPETCDENESDQVLGALKYLIALTLLENVTYRSHYYYHQTESMGSSSEISALFPYFILTSDRVITISRDYSQAILYQDKEFLSLYEESYQKILGETHPFIEESNDLFKIFSLDTTHRMKYVVEPLPCFAYYTTRELLEEKMNKSFPYYEPLLEATDAYYKYFRKESHNMINVFSLKNLRNFMTDGSLLLPEEVYHCLTPDERLMLIQQVRDDLYHDRRKLYAFVDEKIFLNSAVEFINESTLLRLILHYEIDKKLVFKSIELREANMVQAFDEFFTSLPDSNYVLPTEKTIEEMDRIIQEYQ